VPYAIPGSIKGKPTIQILKLDRDILNDARLEHLQKLKLLFQLIAIAIKQQKNQELQDLATDAEKTLRDAISDQAEFAAATRAALQDQFKFVTD
jgi:hypothetical protein